MINGEKTKEIHGEWINDQYYYTVKDIRGKCGGFGSHEIDRRHTDCKSDVLLDKIGIDMACKELGFRRPSKRYRSFSEIQLQKICDKLNGG